MKISSLRHAHSLYNQIEILEDLIKGFEGRDIVSMDINFNCRTVPRLGTKTPIRDKELVDKVRSEYVNMLKSELHLLSEELKGLL